MLLCCMPGYANKLSNRQTAFYFSKLIHLNQKESISKARNFQLKKKKKENLHQKIAYMQEKNKHKYLHGKK